MVCPVLYGVGCWHQERLAHGWSLPEFSARIGFDAGHLSRVENAKRPATEALANACDAAFPERHGWFLDWYEESRHWAEVPAEFRSWAEYEDRADSAPAASSLGSARCGCGRGHAE